jgi:hypothetical protein
MKETIISKRKTISKPSKPTLKQYVKELLKLLEYNDKEANYFSNRAACYLQLEK